MDNETEIKGGVLNLGWGIGSGWRGRVLELEMDTLLPSLGKFLNSLTMWITLAPTLSGCFGGLDR